MPQHPTVQHPASQHPAAQSPVPPSSAPPVNHLDALRACHARQLEREGIPMVLGIADEREPMPRNTDVAQLGSGAAIDEVLRAYYDSLAPWARPDDEGALITAMQVVAFTHFPPDTHQATAPSAGRASG